MLHAPRFAVWLDGREWVRSAREKSYVVGFRLFGTKFGPFRESGYSALRAASVRTPQLLRPDRSFTYPVLRVKKVISALECAAGDGRKALDLKFHAIPVSPAGSAPALLPDGFVLCTNKSGDGTDGTRTCHSRNGQEACAKEEVELV